MNDVISFILRRTTRKDRLDVIEYCENRWPEKYANGVLRNAVRSAFENRKREVECE